MEFESTPVYDKDIKKLDKHEKEELKELLGKILENPEIGKLMEHYANVFSKRTEHKRLVYEIMRKEEKILLLLYKNRDEVYGRLKMMRV